MTLSDAEIERFSRQIILPEVGAVGQGRLRRAHVALAGHGALVEIAALTIAGLGVGRMTLHGGARRLREDLADLDPDLDLTLSGAPLGAAGAAFLVGCNLTATEIDRAGQPLLAAGIDAGGGWLVEGDSATCAGCAARQAASAHRSGDAGAQLAMAAAVAVGSLAGLAVLRRCLGLDPTGTGIWLRFDTVASTLTARTVERVPECPAHGPG